MSETVDFTGKVAIVTGGASGIGAASAHRFAEEGCRVVVADLNAELGAKHAADIGGRFVSLDVGDPSAWARVVDDVLAAEGRLDFAHLNAGVVTTEGDITKLTDAQYDRIIGANLNGVVYGTRAVTRAIGPEGGAIVATASVAGLIAFSPDPIYTLTKHAVVGFVRASALGLGARHVTINAVCPGIVDTPLVGPAREALVAMNLKLIPPSQIADAVVTAIRSGRAGECWVCLPGRDHEVHEFAPVDLERLSGR